MRRRKYEFSPSVPDILTAFSLTLIISSSISAQILDSRVEICQSGYKLHPWTYDLYSPFFQIFLTAPLTCSPGYAKSFTFLPRTYSPFVEIGATLAVVQEISPLKFKILGSVKINKLHENATNSRWQEVQIESPFYVPGNDCYMALLYNDLGNQNLIVPYLSRPAYEQAGDAEWVNDLRFTWNIQSSVSAQPIGKRPSIVAGITTNSMRSIFNDVRHERMIDIKKIFENKWAYSWRWPALLLNVTPSSCQLPPLTEERAYVEIFDGQTRRTKLLSVARKEDIIRPGTSIEILCPDGEAGRMPGGRTKATCSDEGLWGIEFILLCNEPTLPPLTIDYEYDYPTDPPPSPNLTPPPQTLPPPTPSPPTQPPPPSPPIFFPPTQPPPPPPTTTTVAAATTVPLTTTTRDPRVAQCIQEMNPGINTNGDPPLRRFYYDYRQDQCKAFFFYDGPQRNTNNFDQAFTCESRCLGVNIFTST